MKKLSQTFCFVLLLMSPKFAHYRFIRSCKILSLKVQLLLRKKEQQRCEFKTADCFSPVPYRVDRSFEWLEERVWCMGYCVDLDLNMTLESRTLAKKINENSASDKIGSDGAERI